MSVLVLLLISNHDTVISFWLFVWSSLACQQRQEFNWFIRLHWIFPDELMVGERKVSYFLQRSHQLLAIGHWVSAYSFRPPLTW